MTHVDADAHDEDEVEDDGGDVPAVNLHGRHPLASPSAEHLHERKRFPRHRGKIPGLISFKVTACEVISVTGLISQCLTSEDLVNRFFSST